MNSCDSDQNPENYYAQTYDDSVSDWPGEIDFYLQTSEKTKSINGTVLELACGTGRISIRLAQHGVNVVGLDFSPEMLAVAKKKSIGLQNIEWIESDMRSFALDKVFDLAIIPGHSFQNLNTAMDQYNCLVCVKNHLRSGSSLIIHLDHMNRENVEWLGSISNKKRGIFEQKESFVHPKTELVTRALRAWSYEPSTQTATLQTIWEELGENDQVINRIEREAIRLHCVFRLEMEHLLARAGFMPCTVYGDFFRGELLDYGPSMIWIAEVP